MYKVCRNNYFIYSHFYHSQTHTFTIKIKLKNDFSVFQMSNRHLENSKTTFGVIKVRQIIILKENNKLSMV